MGTADTELRKQNRKTGPKATKCAHTDRPHQALGLCKRCYNRHNYKMKHGRSRPRKYKRKTVDGLSPQLREKKEFLQKFPDVGHLAKQKMWYGMSREALAELFISQRGCCKLCSNPPKRRICVDHDHVTGKFRALVCERCNWLLGALDSTTPELLEAAMKLSGRGP